MKICQDTTEAFSCSTDCSVETAVGTGEMLGNGNIFGEFGGYIFNNTRTPGPVEYHPTSNKYNPTEFQPFQWSLRRTDPKTLTGTNLGTYTRTVGGRSFFTGGDQCKNGTWESEIEWVCAAGLRHFDHKVGFFNETEFDFLITSATRPSECSYRFIAEIDCCVCPNNECWEYINGKCHVKPACATVSCSPYEMMVNFKTELYGIVEGISPAPSNGTVNIGGEDFEGHFITCSLGDCGMKYSIDNKT